MGNIPTSTSENSIKRPAPSPQKQQKTQPKSAKILMLGPGSCGKSSIFKQIRYFYGTLRKESFVAYILENILYTIIELITYCKKHRIGFESQENTKAAEKILSSCIDLGNLYKHYTSEIGQLCKKLWNDKNIQLHYFDAYREMHLSDGVTHLFENIDRIISSQYTPTIEDIMACKIKTTGLIDYNFKYDNINFCIMDTGGQRNERKKWIYAFENVTVLVYLAALNDFHKLCYEDGTTNRLEENLNVFEEIINSKWFIDIPVILLLTKPDILLNALESGIKLNKYFPEYMGDNDFEDVTFWIYEQFMNRCKTKDKKSITTFILNANQTKETEAFFSHMIGITKDAFFNTKTYQGYGKVHNLFDPASIYSGLQSQRKRNLLRMLSTGNFHDTLFVLNQL